MRTRKREKRMRLMGVAISMLNVSVYETCLGRKEGLFRTRRQKVEFPLLSVLDCCQLFHLVMRRLECCMKGSRQLTVCHGGGVWGLFDV